MRLLFEIDTKDYNPNGKAYIRPSARCLNIKGGLIAMVHSLKYDYYKFPGGGIKKDETNIDALIRETKEETGLNIIEESIKEFGYVHRIQKDNGIEYDIFIQDNYYYLCDTEEMVDRQNLDDYEEYENFTLEYVNYQKAIETNRTKDHGPKDLHMIERESKVLEILKDEGYFD